MYEQSDNSFYSGIPADFQRLYVEHLVSYLKDCLSDPVKLQELDSYICSAQPTQNAKMNRR